MSKGRWLSAGFGRAVLFGPQLEAEPPSQEEGFVLLCTMSAQILSNCGAECGAGHFRGARLCASTAWGTQHSQQLSSPQGTQPWSLKHHLQQEPHCSQSQGKEDPLLKSLCHLTRKPKSSPRAHLLLQSISIRSAGASGSSPNTPAEETSEG